MIAAWIVFPLVLTALAVGWGLLVELAAGRQMPRSLLPGAGLAAIVVVAGFSTASDPTAELTVPIVLAGGVAGAALGLRGRLRVPPEPWMAAAAVAVFAAYAAPIVLSGEATFAGYMLLDDTATWLALTDRVMEHGRDLSGLAPSSYEATLDFNLGDGYPVGAFLPLGVGAEIVGQDPAWTIQPYMAWLAAVLAMSMTRIALVASNLPLVRAGIAFVAAQPALLVGYYLWGGIKEMAAAALIAAAAAMAAERAADWSSPRTLVPLAVLCSALLGVLTLGGLAWVAPILLGAGALAARELGFRGIRAAGIALAGMIAVLCVPLVTGGALLPPTSSPLDSDSAQGNLITPLSYLQAFGIWPVGDFRVEPSSLEFTYLAITVLIAAAIYGAWWAWGRQPGLLLYLGSALVGAVALIVAGSPWVEGKALATASPAFALAGMVGCVALIRNRRTEEGWIAVTVVVVGVFLSNMLAYTEVALAPRDQLAELESVGERIAGQGPTLMTEYQPYGVRHFLRDADPEAVGELRRQRIPLRSGGVVRKGRTADLDQLDPKGVLFYRTIVLRRSPAASRPPAPYDLVSAGDYYEVWQRPEGSEGDVIAHLPLGVEPPAPVTAARTSRTAKPRCKQVEELVNLAGPNGALVAAAGSQPVAATPLRGEYPRNWARGDSSAVVYPGRTGSLSTRVAVEIAGEYTLWAGGSVRGQLRSFIDGVEVGEARTQLNNSGEFVELGGAALDAGLHTLTIEYSKGGLRPGTRGTRLPLGPVVLGSSAGDLAAKPGALTEVPAARASTLCAGRWDWIEAVRAREP